MQWLIMYQTFRGVTKITQFALQVNLQYNVINYTQTIKLNHNADAHADILNHNLSSGRVRQDTGHHHNTSNTDIYMKINMMTSDMNWT